MGLIKRFISKARGCAQLRRRLLPPKFQVGSINQNLKGQAPVYTTYYTCVYGAFLMQYLICVCV